MDSETSALRKSSHSKAHHRHKSQQVASIKSLFSCRPIKSCKDFFGISDLYLHIQLLIVLVLYLLVLGRFPRRAWNFYIEAMLIPSYRPEWGKYRDWSYQSPDRAEKTEEQQRERELKRQQAKLDDLAKWVGLS